MSEEFDELGFEPEPGEECPKCHAMTLHMGFGLAGGGYGAYAYCDAEGCDHFEKWQEHDA